MTTLQNMVLEANIEKADFERCKRELNIVEIQKTIEMEEKLNLEDKKGILCINLDISQTTLLRYISLNLRLIAY